MVKSLIWSKRAVSKLEEVMKWVQFRRTLTVVECMQRYKSWRNFQQVPTSNLRYAWENLIIAIIENGLLHFSRVSQKEKKEKSSATFDLVFGLELCAFRTQSRANKLYPLILFTYLLSSPSSISYSSFFTSSPSPIFHLFFFLFVFHLPPPFLLLFSPASSNVLNGRRLCHLVRQHSHARRRSEAFAPTPSPAPLLSLCLHVAGPGRTPRLCSTSRSKRIFQVDAPPTGQEQRASGGTSSFSNSMAPLPLAPGLGLKVSPQGPPALTGNNSTVLRVRASRASRHEVRYGCRRCDERGCWRIFWTYDRVTAEHGCFRFNNAKHGPISKTPPKL